jgi:prepilin-type processing-associated H-X9-DG protein
MVVEAAGRPDWYISGGHGPGAQINGYCGGFGGWADPGSADSMLFGSDAVGIFPPVGPVVVNGSNDFDIYAFHAVGANCGFADGSVHFINTTIPNYIVASLLTARGGETTTNLDQ